MPEHVIRLRAGWKLVRLDEAGLPTQDRITLPMDWASLQIVGRFVRILRSFQRPPIDSEVESTWLRVADSPGILELKLNNESFAGGSSVVQVALEMAIGPLSARRNELEILVDLAEASKLPDWGKISLIIRSSPGIA